MTIETWSIPLAGLALAAGQVGVAMVTLRGKASADVVVELTKRCDSFEMRLSRCEQEREQCERDRVRLLERIAQITAVALLLLAPLPAAAQPAAGTDPSGTPPLFYAPTYCYTSAGGGGGAIFVVIAKGNPVCDHLAIADVCWRQRDYACAKRQRARAERAAWWRDLRDRLTLGLL